MLEQRASNRNSGMGALMGYAVGLGLGALCGITRAQARGLPSPLAAVGRTAVAMAFSDIPAVAMGETNLKEWTPASWLSDIVPHAL